MRIADRGNLVSTRKKESVITLEQHEEQYIRFVRTPYPSGANYFTVELAVLKAITLELADLFGLAPQV